MSSLYFSYTQSFLSQPANITVKLQGLSLNTTANQLPPRIFYKVCSDSNAVNCYLNAAEGNGSSKTMTELTNNSVLAFGSSVRMGVINHDPKVCKVPSSCYYLISLYYPDNTTLPMRTSFFISTYLSNSQSIEMDLVYENVIL
jgi:hypothetical protein